MYVKKDAARSREEQIAKPRDPDELALAVTDVCIRYLRNVGETFRTHAQIMYVLNPVNTVCALPTEHKKIDTLNRLKQYISFLVDSYKGRNRMTNYTEEIWGTMSITQNEWSWRMMRNFLDNKCLENGDIYPQSPPYAQAFQSLCEEVNDIKHPKEQDKPENKNA